MTTYQRSETMADAEMAQGAVTLVEREVQQGRYDMRYHTLIVDHERHGRLLLVQGYGGEDTIRGGAYRWEHGLIVRLQPGDTLDGLRAAPWNEGASTLYACTAGADPARPLLLWPGYAIAALAGAAMASEPQD